MTHLIILPFILPLLAGALLAGLKDERIVLQRTLSLVAQLALLLVAVLLLGQAERDGVHVYAMGNWQAPFGIVFVLDRLSALLVLATAVLGLLANLYAMAGDDRLGRSFHALFQFQLAGINGAFLTGDLFNLFVCFEIMLIASYALLLHGLGAERLRSAVHYVILNLAGSALFLLGAGLFYGIAGTLNLADLARYVAQAEGDERYLLQAAGWVLLLVFGLKAAVLPLHFWLPHAYASASAPVAALFAIMTKVGLYAILRMTSLVFAAQTGAGPEFGVELLFVLALLTLLIGSLGAFVSARFNQLLAYLVLVSVGTLLAGISMGSQEALSASLYYLLHSTWVIAGLFLLSGVLIRQRAGMTDRLVAGTALLTPARLGAVFFIAAIAIAGLPPLSGFIGKLGLLQAARGMQAVFFWTVLLLASFVVILALSRAGKMLFWEGQGECAAEAEFSWLEFACALALISAAGWLVAFAGPVFEFCQAAARQLLQPELYLQQLEGG